MGYAENQVKKSDYFNPTIRTNKCIVAYIRVMRQASELLLTQDFNFKPEMLPLVTKTMTEVRKDLENAYKNSILKTEADINLLETYLK